MQKVRASDCGVSACLGPGLSGQGGFLHLALDQRWLLEARPLCWFCDQELESADHILANCSFAREVWWGVLSSCHCQCSFPSNFSLQDWWAHLRQLQPLEHRKGLDSLFMLTAWHLWKERNARLFQHSSRSCLELQGAILQEGFL